MERLRLRQRVRVKEAHFLHGVVVDVEPDGSLGLISLDERGAAPYHATELEAETPCDCIHCQIDALMGAAKT